MYMSSTKRDNKRNVFVYLPGRNLEAEGEKIVRNSVKSLPGQNTSTSGLNLEVGPKKRENCRVQFITFHILRNFEILS